LSIQDYEDLEDLVETALIVGALLAAPFVRRRLGLGRASPAPTMMIPLLAVPGGRTHIQESQSP